MSLWGPKADPTVKNTYTYLYQQHNIPRKIQRRSRSLWRAQERAMLRPAPC